MSNHAPPLYNPREVSPEILEEMLVGRDDILKEVLDDLSHQVASATRQHWLIRGPRGIGKTHLVAILYHRIRGTPELSSRLLPIWLGEAAAYDAYSAGMLLLAIANGLVEELETTGDPNALPLRNAIDNEASTGDDPALFNGLCDLLKEEAVRQQRVLVVLMENLDAWLDNASGQRGTVEAGKLRSLLSDDKEFLFISTTPTRYLPKLSKPGSPLFGHLRERQLRPLSEDELRELFQRLRKITGRPFDVNDDSTRPESRLRWRVLRRLAGGNPRAAAMAFRVVSHATGIRAMVEELSALLDLQTAYYEARLAKLAPRERAIVRVLALSPTTLTVPEIALRSRLPERSLSTQIKRLLDEGHIAQAGDERGKGSVFELTDGLFRTWYHYRSGHRELEPLVRFLAMWHEERELELNLASLRRDLDSANSALERAWLKSTEVQIRSALEYVRSPTGSSERERLWAECARETAETIARGTPAMLGFGGGPVGDEMFLRGMKLLASGRKQEAEAVFGDLAVRIGDATENAAPERAVEASIFRASVLQLSGQANESQALLRSVIDRFHDSAEPKLARQVRMATVNLASSLAQSGHYEQAIVTYQEALSLFRKGVEPNDTEIGAAALVDLGRVLEIVGRREEAIAAWRDVVGRFDNNPKSRLVFSFAVASCELGNVLWKAGLREEAITTFSDLTNRLDDHPMKTGQPGEAIATPSDFIRLYDNPIRSARKFVVQAMLSLGMLLEEDGREQEAIAVYQALVARFGTGAKDELEAVAVAACRLAALFLRTGQPENAMAAWKDIISRYANIRESPFLERVADARRNLAAALSQAGQAHEAIAAYRDLVSSLGNRAEAAVRESVDGAIFDLAILLAKLGQQAEAMAANRELIGRSAGTEKPGLGIARAMYNLGILLQSSGQGEEAILTYGELIRMFGDRSEPEVEVVIAQAMLNMAVTFQQAGRLDAMVETCRQLISRFTDSTEPQLKQQVLLAMYNLAGALHESGRLPEAVEAYRDLIRRSGDSAESTLIGGAMGNLGIVLDKAGLHNQAITAYRDHIGRFGNSIHPELKEQVARVILNLSNELVKAGEHDQAAVALRDYIVRFSDNAGAQLNQQVAMVMGNLGQALVQAGRHEEALPLFREVIARWGGAAEARMQMIVGSTRLLLATVLRESNRHAEGVEVAARLVDDADAIGNVSLGTMACLTLADQLHALGRFTEARLVQAGAVRRLVESSNVPSGFYAENSASADPVLRATLIRLPLGDAKELFDEITTKASPAMRELIQFARFVLDLLMAEEPATRKVKLSPAARKKRALARVPPELRETVAESAEAIKQAREKLRKKTSHADVGVRD